MYYLQSRYYDPSLGRFINADALASTGQGILGNNMFAYCNNNPVVYRDITGTLRDLCTISMDTPGIGYLYDQEAEPFSSKKLSLGTIGSNGCGVFATYNAMISLGDSRLFAEIYDYYTASSSSVLLYGKMGIAPWAVGSYFEEQGYTVRMTDDYDEIEVLSSLADASILLYVYSGKSLGAHYVEYSKSPTGYIGRNTGIGNGETAFSSAVAYGYKGSRLYAIGIFIFKKEG